MSACCVSLRFTSLHGALGGDCRRNLFLIKKENNRTKKERVGGGGGGGGGGERER